MTIPDPHATSTLEAQVAELLEGLPGISSSPGGAGRSWSRGDVEFAVVGPFGIEILLDREIAAAATKTPDAAISARGPDWVRFNPRALDAHALDRLQAWLELGRRRAGE
ncbi:MAG TPA: hypothetical protein VFP56_12375 [Candidatus Limnocylindrales bacterium]|nr:hypothetical protein [Candidatus Limnocylindrales bacterium]